MKNLLRLTAVLGALAVVLGAFGAHGLKSLVGPAELDTFATGVRYHFYHTLAIGLVAAVFRTGGISRPQLNWAARCWTIGVLLFSGSLYLLSLRSQLPFSVSWLGPVTPIGGTFFIAGWVLLFLATAKISKHV